MPNNKTSTHHYRPEIDGLRAISALFGIFFHLGLTSFSKGFLALEIFFVISGYLITKILVLEYERTHQIHFLNFYQRRARRLLPALFTTVFITMIFGLFILPYGYLKDFSNSITHTLVGLSNFQFFFEDDYFDISSKLKPLLHTWSLGVEEQFYLIWPLATLFFLKTCGTFKSTTKTLIIFILVSVFGLLTYSFRSYTTMTFYLMPFRVFEFLFGASIVFLERDFSLGKKISDFFSFLGMALVVYIIFIFKPDSKELFFHSLLTCIGSFLFVLFSRNSTYAKVLIGNRFLTYLGKASYSIYLVHWPIISYFRHLHQRSPNVQESVVIVIVTLFLGILQYEIIEKKFRISKKQNYLLAQYNPFLAYATVLIPTIIFANNLSHGHFSLKRDQLVSYEKKQLDHDNFLAEWDLACFLGDEESNKRDAHGKIICKPDAENQILTIGNSHEFDSYLTFKKLYAQGNPDINLVFSSMNSYKRNVCKFYFTEDDEFKAKNAKCKKLEIILQDYKTISNKFNTIIISGHGLVTPYILKYASKLQEANPKLKLIIHGSLLVIKEYHCFDMINRFMDPKACNKESFLDHFYQNEEKRISELFPQLQFTYLDRIDLFCPKRTIESCEIFVGDMPLFFDAHHFNYHGIMEQVRRIQARAELYELLHSKLLK